MKAGTSPAMLRTPLRFGAARPRNSCRVVPAATVGSYRFGAAARYRAAAPALSQNFLLRISAPCGAFTRKRKAFCE
jgi:hypothetical protein